jgi:hypothetical protein
MARAAEDPGIPKRAQAATGRSRSARLRRVDLDAVRIGSARSQAATVRTRAHLRGVGAGVHGCVPLGSVHRRSSSRSRLLPIPASPWMSSEGGSARSCLHPGARQGRPFHVAPDEPMGRLRAESSRGRVLPGRGSEPLVRSPGSRQWAGPRARSERRSRRRGTPAPADRSPLRTATRMRLRYADSVGDPAR